MKGNLQFLYKMSPPEIEVIDYGFSSSILWVTGIHEGSTVFTQYSQILSSIESDSIGSIDSWKSIHSQHYSYLHDDQITQKTSNDFSDSILDRIYYPDRFNNVILYNVLQELFPEILKDNLSSFSPSNSSSLLSNQLKLCIYEAMHQSSLLSNYPISNNENQDQENQQFNESQGGGDDIYPKWKRFLDCCEQYWKRDSYPFGLFVSSNSSIIFIISSSKCFFIRKCSEIEEIYKYFLYEEFYHSNHKINPLNLQINELLLSKYPNDHYYNHHVDILYNDFNYLFECTQFLISSFEIGHLAQLDQEILHVNDIGNSFIQSIHLLYHYSKSNDFQNSIDQIFRIFKLIKHPTEIFSIIIHFFESHVPTSFTDEEKNKFSSSSSSSSIEISEFSKKLLCSCFRQFSESNYIIIRNLTILCLFLTFNKHQLFISVIESIDLNSKIIPKLLHLTRHYSVFHWLSLQQTSKSATLPGKSSSSSSSSSHDISDHFSSSLHLNNQVNDHSIPLMEFYLSDSLFIHKNQSNGPNPNHDMMIIDHDHHHHHQIESYDLFSLLNECLEFIIYRLAFSCSRLRECNLPQSHSSMEDMACFLDNTNQYEILQKYLHLLHSQSNQISYYYGKVYLYLNHFHKASDYFLKSSHDLNSSDKLTFYLQTSKLFSSYSPNHECFDFLFRAISSCDLNSNQSSTVSMIWSSIFNESIKQFNYELAYNSMIYCSGIQQFNNLCDLIKILCENSRLDLLCFHDHFSFPWSGCVDFLISDQIQSIALVDAVDRVLQINARQSNILLSPNYYQILFSFHSHRGNYMKGKNNKTKKFSFFFFLFQFLTFF